MYIYIVCVLICAPLPFTAISLIPDKHLNWLQAQSLAWCQYTGLSIFVVFCLDVSYPFVVLFRLDLDFYLAFVLVGAEKTYSVYSARVCVCVA